MGIQETYISVNDLAISSKWNDPSSIQSDPSSSHMHKAEPHKSYGDREGAQGYYSSLNIYIGRFPIRRKTSTDPDACSMES